MAVANVPDSNQSFAERLGHWLNWTDAISLSVALDGSAVKASEGLSATQSTSARAAAEDLARVRAALIRSMTEDAGAKIDKADTADRTRPMRPEPVLSESMQSEADYSPYRRHYIARQRTMETSIGPLRARMRAALAGHSATAGKLAALDAVLDDVLRERENHLLSTIPALLEKRFEQKRQAHRETPGEAWLPACRQEMQCVLLAELEIRLQPVEGLLAALHHQTRKPQ